MLTSQACTDESLRSPTLLPWSARLGVAIPADAELRAKPGVRAAWERCFVAAALDDGGMLRPGRRGLGFGVVPGDPLAAALVDSGCSLVTVAVDGVVPGDVGELDFSWSTGVVGVQGSVAAGADFVVEQVGRLRSGGIAVHTVDPGVSSDSASPAGGHAVAYRPRDVEDLVGRLRSAGHRIAYDLSGTVAHPGRGATTSFAFVAVADGGWAAWRAGARRLHIHRSGVAASGGNGSPAGGPGSPPTGAPGAEGGA